MRCFVSIDIPEEVRGEIKKIQDGLPEFYGKKTESRNLHLTLKFLGEISEEKIEKVKERLREINQGKFEVEVGEAGFFDNANSKYYKRSGVVWLYLSGCEDLQGKVDRGLEGLFKPARRFMSHLTIARVKELKDKKYFLDELNKIKIPKINFVVDRFCLKESILRTEGSVYEDLEIYDLS